MGRKKHPAKAIQTIWEGSASPFTGPSLMRERLRAGKRGQQHQAGPAAAEQGGNDRNALVVLLKRLRLGWRANEDSIVNISEGNKPIARTARQP